jgi:hypothetical protein
MRRRGCRLRPRRRRGHAFEGPPGRALSPDLAQPAAPTLLNLLQRNRLFTHRTAVTPTAGLAVVADLGRATWALEKRPHWWGTLSRHFAHACLLRRHHSPAKPHPTTSEPVGRRSAWWGPVQRGEVSLIAPRTTLDGLAAVCQRRPCRSSVLVRDDTTQERSQCPHPRLLA